MSLSERIQQINREISATVERAIAELRQDLTQRLRASSDEILRHVGEIAPQLPSSFLAHEDLGPATEQLARDAASAAVVEVREAAAAIDRSRSQAEVLAALLRESARFASRAAVLIVRGGEMRGWGGHGFGDAEPAIRDLSFAPAAGGGWSHLAQGAGAVRLNSQDSAELCSRIEAPLPHEGILIPLVLRDRVAAGLYADRESAPALPEVAALQILCFAAAQAIELLPFRERPFTATLVAPPADTAPAAAPETTAQTAETTPAAAAPEPPAPEPPTPQEAELEAAPELEVEAEPETAESAAAAPELTALPELPDETAAETPAATVYQPIPRDSRETLRPVPPLAAPEPEPRPEAAPATTRFTAPLPQVNPQSQPQSTPPGNAEETVLLQRSGLREAAAAPSPPPLRSVPPPAAEPAGESTGLGIPEVKPPSGVEGPGWAFATSRVQVSPNEEAQHEEARRLARLLVSEIKLYNEEQVEEGRRRRDVYERLKDDIDRSRQMYEERVEPKILKSTDYFYQELVRILAAGDAKALGI